MRFFIKKVGILLRCYTQNIDGLERLAGVPDEKLVEGQLLFLPQLFPYFEIYFFLPNFKISRGAENTKNQHRKKVVLLGALVKFNIL